MRPKPHHAGYHSGGENASIYRTASVAKCFKASALMQLVKLRKLHDEVCSRLSRQVALQR